MSAGCGRSSICYHVKAFGHEKYITIKWTIYAVVRRIKASVLFLNFCIYASSHRDKTKWKSESLLYYELVASVLASETLVKQHTDRKGI